MSVKNSVKVSTTTTREIIIEKADLLRLLSSAGYDIPSSAYVFVEVPGGGDYSSTDLELIGSRGVKVRWTIGRPCSVLCPTGTCTRSATKQRARDARAESRARGVREL